MRRKISGVFGKNPSAVNAAKEDEKQRQVEEAEKQRLVEEAEKQKQAEEAEKQRQVEEVEKQRQVEVQQAQDVSDTIQKIQTAIKSREGDKDAMSGALFHSHFQHFAAKFKVLVGKNETAAALEVFKHNAPFFSEKTRNAFQAQGLVRLNDQRRWEAALPETVNQFMDQAVEQSGVPAMSS